MKEVEHDISGASTLIKRLSKSERTFISKKLSQSKGNKVHRLLFDVVVKNNSYGEEDIRQQFELHSDSKNYTLIKSQLLELVLRCLRDLDHGRSLESELYGRLESAKILSRKMLKAQALKIVHQVLKEAEKKDFFALQLKAAEMLIEIGSRTQNFREIENGIKEVNSLLLKQKLHNNILSLTHQANVVFFTLNGKPDYKNRYEEIIAQVSEVAHPSLRVQSALHHLRGFTSMVYDCDYDKATTCFEANLALIEQDPEYAKQYPMIFRTAAYNLALCLDSLNEEEKFNGLMKKFAELRTGNEYEDAESLGQIIILKQSFLQQRNMHKEVIEYIQSYEDRLHTDSAFMPPGLKLVLFTNCAISHFILREWKKALRWNNFVINDNFDVSNDLVCFNKIMNLIVHYELGNMDLIESVLPNLLRYLVSRDYYNGTFKLIYDFFAECIKDYTGEKEHALLLQLHKGLQTVVIQDNFNLKEVNQLFLDWAKQKIKPEKQQ
jgi:hypothetical protein